MSLLPWGCGSAGAENSLTDIASHINLPEESGGLQMSDPYFEAIQEQWRYIRGLYLTFSSKKPITLYDIQDKKYMLILTGRYLDFYNGKRPHQSLDGATPDQAYFIKLPLRVAA
jgi:hypothetical protein